MRGAVSQRLILTDDQQRIPASERRRPSSRAPHMRAGRPRPPPPAPSRSIASPPPHVSGQGFHCLMVKPPDPREASQTGHTAPPLGGHDRHLSTLGVEFE